MKQRYHVYSIDRRDPEQLTKLDEVYAATGHHAIREVIDFRAEDGWPLRAGDLLAVPEWSVARAHHEEAA